MNNSLLHRLSTAGADPVSAASPCGDSVRYEAVFEELEAELAKLESLNAETVDWKRVVELASTILHDSSKDLLVASYLTQALLITEGYSGLSTGLKILNDMVSIHWEGLFPPAKRMRARQTAIAWLAERAGAYISDRSPVASEASAVVEAAGLIRQLDAELVDKMGDQAPMVSELSKPLKNYKQSAEAASTVVATPDEKPTDKGAVVQDASPAPTPAVSKSRSSKPVPQTVVDIESDADAKKLLRQVQDSVRQVSSFRAGKKLSDASAFRLARVAAWMLIDVSPPDTDGVTQVAPPAAERIKYFDAQIEKADYSTVLPELEKTLSRAPFWLDGQNKVVIVLRAMGGKYEDAATSVIDETRNFLQRVPSIPNLLFSDNTPFASDQTKMWLQSEVMSADVGSGTSSAGSCTAQVNEWDSALERARKTVVAGDKEAAIKTLSAAMEGAAQLRDKCYWRCALADLLLQTGDALAAAGVLVNMTALSDDYRLREWEPELLSRIYSLLYQSYRKQQVRKKDDALLAERVNNAYEMLCWFDPVTALNAKGEK